MSRLAIQLQDDLCSVLRGGSYCSIKQNYLSLRFLQIALNIEQYFVTDWEP